MSASQQAQAEQAPWLGLLKWSLNYMDGTVPSSESENFKAMSDEDKKFLEEVMKNGIIDEGDRMKHILNELVAYLDSLQKNKNEDEDKKKDSSSSLSVEEITLLLEELQDIVEQIDFAKSFASMGGLQFLIGCASSSSSTGAGESEGENASANENKIAVPSSIRAACLGILATLCQNNPAVQMMMLEQGNIPKLIQVYFETLDQREIDDNHDQCQMITAKVMQAMSSCVRNHDVAENIYCMNAAGIKMIEAGLGVYSSSSSSSSSSIVPPNAALRRRTLFFLQALITSDSADGDRVRLFSNAIKFVAGHYLAEEVTNGDIQYNNDAQTREMGLAMLCRILEQKNSVNAILDVKNHLVSVGVRRVTILRSLEGEEKDMAEEELRLWESLISSLAQAVRDTDSAPLMIAGRPENDSGETLAQ